MNEVQDLIGADRLIFLDLHGLIRSVRHSDSAISEFDTSCFSGEYVTGDVTHEYLQRLANERSDAAKARQNGLHGGVEVQSNMVSVSAGDDTADTAIGM